MRGRSRYPNASDTLLSGELGSGTNFQTICTKCGQDAIQSTERIPFIDNFGFVLDLAEKRENIMAKTPIDMLLTLLQKCSRCLCVPSGHLLFLPLLKWQGQITRRKGR